MTLKLPPPPTLSKDFQQLNRWLLELTSILNSQGLINAGNVDGLTSLSDHVDTIAVQTTENTAGIVANSEGIATNTGDIATNTAGIAANNTSIAALNTAVAANTAAIANNTTDIAALNTAVTALQARSQIRNGAGVPGAGLGANGDLYLNNTGGVGTRLYGKIAGAWVVIA